MVGSVFQPKKNPVFGS